MKPEQDFYHWLKSQMPVEAVLQRVESVTSNGIPDVCACYQGIIVWWELKVLHAGKCLIRKEQFAWGHRLAEAGGLVVLVCDAPDGILVWKYPDVYVKQHGKYLEVNLAAYCEIVKDPKLLKTILFRK
jgi:hypothetical protein